VDNLTVKINFSHSSQKKKKNLISLRLEIYSSFAYFQVSASGQPEKQYLQVSETSFSQAVSPRSLKK
jgi:hypothetical protein